jgi:hypothetical protein
MMGSITARRLTEALFAAGVHAAAETALTRRAMKVTKAVRIFTSTSVVF